MSLVVVFGISLIVRFFAFKETIYFGFDEARDALVSESIYLKGDLRLIGPPATGETGLYHGPAYWYLVGPLYILFQGNLYLIAGLFKVINALGVLLVYLIGKKLFSERVGLLASFLYAISFEQSQYATYVGKESIALILWLIIMLVIVSIYKKESRALKYGLPLIALCYGLMLQFNIIYVGFGLGIFSMVAVLLHHFKRVEVETWLLSIFVFGMTLSTYILAEIKYDFREITSAVKLIRSGFGIMSEGESKYHLYWGKFLTMFRDNLMGLNLEVQWQFMVLVVTTISLTLWLLFKAIKDKRFTLLLIWLFTWVGIMMAGGHMAYYTNVGVSVSLLIVTAFILDKISSKKSIYILILFGITAGNLLLINSRKEKGLIQAIKPQPNMNLVDERRVIDHMYSIADGRGFTVRLTGIPYKVQTVWYYLLREYGYEKYGYYPFWEHGNASGFPGELPPPKNGSTCLRFLVREPMTGLPVDLVNEDNKQENYFSKVKEIRPFGFFTVQERYDPGTECHNNRP